MSGLGKGSENGNGNNPPLPPPYLANTSVFAISTPTSSTHFQHPSEYSSNAEASGSASAFGSAGGAGGFDKSIKRGKTGCITCRIRKKRCDEAKPICETCKRLGLDCMGYSVQRPSWLKAKDVETRLKHEIKQISTERRRTKKPKELGIKTSSSSGKSKGKPRKKQDDIDKSPFTTAQYDYGDGNGQGELDLGDGDEQNDDLAEDDHTQICGRGMGTEVTMEYDNLETASHFGSGSGSGSSKSGYKPNHTMVDPILTHQPSTHPTAIGNIHEATANFEGGWQSIQANSGPSTATTAFEGWTWDASQTQPFAGEQPPNYADWSKAFTPPTTSSVLAMSESLPSPHTAPTQYYQSGPSPQFSNAVPYHYRQPDTHSHPQYPPVQGHTHTHAQAQHPHRSAFPHAHTRPDTEYYSSQARPQPSILELFHVQPPGQPHPPPRPRLQADLEQQQQQVQHQHQHQQPRLTQQLRQQGQQQEAEGTDQDGQQGNMNVQKYSPTTAHFQNLSNPNTSLDELWLWLLNSQPDVLSNLQSPSPSIHNSLKVATSSRQRYFNHYLNIVLPLQYRFIEYTITNFLAPLALSDEVVMESLKSLAALHLSVYRKKGRKGNRKSSKPKNKRDWYSQAVLKNNNGELIIRSGANPEGSQMRIQGEEVRSDEEEGDDDEKIAKKSFEKTVKTLRTISLDNNNAHQNNSDGILVSSISAISYIIFKGGINKQWVESLEISRKCLWFALNNSPELGVFIPTTTKVPDQHNPYYSQNILLQQNQKKSSSTAASDPSQMGQGQQQQQQQQQQQGGSPWKRYKIFLHAMIRTDIFGSITENKASDLLPVYRFLLNRSPIDYLSSTTADELRNIIPNMEDIDNTTLLALAETVGLSDWRAKSLREGRLDVEELVRRGSSIKTLLNERSWREKQMLHCQFQYQYQGQGQGKGKDQTRHYHQQSYDQHAQKSSGNGITENLSENEIEKGKLMSNCFYESTKLLLAITINGPYPRLNPLKEPINRLIATIEELAVLEAQMNLSTTSSTTSSSFSGSNASITSENEHYNDMTGTNAIQSTSPTTTTSSSVHSGSASATGPGPYPHQVYHHHFVSSHNVNCNTTNGRGTGIAENPSTAPATTNADPSSSTNSARSKRSNEFIRSLIFPIALTACHCTSDLQLYFRGLFLNLNKDSFLFGNTKYIWKLIEKVWEKRNALPEGTGDNEPIDWLVVMRELGWEKGILLI
ncbi:uncharacterized protein I303_107480 [Kwoniella dejecticola CBS 10117]|uniref:Zn(2)-C6 fungal-type domain-containing protein n=1 Tax=Kwoniella dejecticola CBS 10117 TaxID=1296121 RepID=A0A1A5ZZS9_9TREE|nr:uncharacterized protein I303_06885 [Kwoniella dejecticola CBS 10117]OBR83320.1 hypothetical protein I303_06885 [Kwoniella dejecticola CBS 10117]